MTLSWYSIWKGADVWSKRGTEAREHCQDDENGAAERSLERVTWGERNADWLALVCQRHQERSCWGDYNTVLTAQQSVESWNPCLLLQRPEGPFGGNWWRKCGRPVLAGSDITWLMHVPHTLPRKPLLPAGFMLFRGHRACSCRELISCSTWRASGCKMVISFPGPPT